MSKITMVILVICLISVTIFITYDGIDFEKSLVNLEKRVELSKKSVVLSEEFYVLMQEDPQNKERMCENLRENYLLHQEMLELNKL